MSADKEFHTVAATLKTTTDQFLPMRSRLQMLPIASFN